MGGGGRWRLGIPVGGRRAEGERLCFTSSGKQSQQAMKPESDLRGSRSHSAHCLGWSLVVSAPQSPAHTAWSPTPDLPQAAKSKAYKGGSWASTALMLASILLCMGTVLQKMPG